MIMFKAVVQIIADMLASGEYVVICGEQMVTVIDLHDDYFSMFDGVEDWNHEYGSTLDVKIYQRITLT